MGRGIDKCYILYPCTISADRYVGVYSRGRWLPEERKVMLYRSDHKQLMNGFMRAYDEAVHHTTTQKNMDTIVFAFVLVKTILESTTSDTIEFVEEAIDDACAVMDWR